MTTTTTNNDDDDGKENVFSFVVNSSAVSSCLLPGQQTPELLDVPAGAGRLCGADPEPEEQRAGSPAQPGDRCGRLLRRDAGGLVQDEVPQCSRWVGISARNSHRLCPSETAVTQTAAQRSETQ